jgi:hypothetical protein
MQPLNKTKAEQSHRARMQAEQTVTARSRPRRDLRAFCLVPLAFEIGSDRHGVLIEAAIGMWVSYEGET